MNTLYTQLDGLTVMESLKDEQYDFILLDVPQYGVNECPISEFKYESGETSARQYLAKVRNVPISSITIADVEAERDRQNRIQRRKYADYIAKIIENAHRLTNNDGHVAFLVTGREIEFGQIDYKMILDQFFPSCTNYIIEKQPNILTNSNNCHDILYICSKKKDYRFPVLQEYKPLEDYEHKDEHDYYELRPLYSRDNLRKKWIFNWNELVLPNDCCWRYPKEKLDQLYAQNRIIIKNGRAYEKYYRSEHPVKASSVWKAHDPLKDLRTFSIDLDSLKRLFIIYLQEGDTILCPFDWDGKVSWYSDKMDIKWTSVYYPASPRTVLDAIPKEHYSTVTTLGSIPKRKYRKNVVASHSDVVERMGQTISETDNIDMFPLAFISYSSIEYDIAKQVKSMLEQNGITCWMAPESIPGGSNYAKEIPAALEACDVFVLLLSERSQVSIWVEKELNQALSLDKVIIPLHLDQSILTRSFNFLLLNVQRIEAYHNLNLSLERLVKRIKALSSVQHD